MFWAEFGVLPGAPFTEVALRVSLHPTWADGARGAGPCLLSPALFQSRVVPVLLQLFQVHEEHVRMVLLSHLEAYVSHFTQEQLRTVILPQVSCGRWRWRWGLTRAGGGCDQLAVKQGFSA